MGIEGLSEALENEINNEMKPIEQAEQAKDQAAGQSTDKASTQKVEDPEFDLGVNEKGEPLKFKKSQILEFHKGSMLNADYTKKTQELTAQKEELKEMFGIVEHLKANPKKAEKIIAILDEKEDALQDKKEENIDTLKDLPADDPYAIALRNQNKKIDELLKINSNLQGKLDSFGNNLKANEETKQRETAQAVLNKGLEDVSKTFTFDSDKEKDFWRRGVLTVLMNNPNDYTKLDEAGFLGYLSKIGKAEFDNINTIGEERLKKHIASKGGTPPLSTPGGAAGKPLSSKPTGDNMEDIISEALENERGKT